MSKTKFKIIKNPKKKLPQNEKKNFHMQLSELLEESWGKFDEEYIEKSMLNSYYLCMAYKDEELIGAMPIKKVKVFNDYVYSFGLTAVSPSHRSQNLMKRMASILAKRIILENLIRFKLKIELIFITPNIRTIGTLSKISDFIYPNPHNIDEDGRIEEADDITWERVNEFLSVSKENVRKLEREGCVMEGFYDERPELAFKDKIEHSHSQIDKFGERYLYSGKGRELVVRAIISLKRIILNAL